MSAIPTLLARLSSGEITAAVTLLDAFCQGGHHGEADDLRRLVGRLLARYGGPADDLPGAWDEFRRDLSTTFWPWLKDPGALLLACERDCQQLHWKASLDAPAKSRRCVFVPPVGRFA